jgi:hypothetical protein
MSTTIVHQEKKEKTDAGWNELIVYSESAIETYIQKINALRKSLIYFKKQAELGAPCPLKKEHRHRELS